MYEELKDITPEQLVEELPMCILYQETPTYGHWTLLHNTSDGIEFFDSYGFKPDEEFGEMEWKQPHHIAEALYHLSQHTPIAYNPYKFQKPQAGINTCGRWVILRELLSELNIDEFAKAITSTALKLGMNTDELVTHSFSDALGGYLNYKHLNKLNVMSIRGSINPELAERSAMALAQYNAFSHRRRTKMLYFLRKVKAANKKYFNEHYNDWLSHNPIASEKDKETKAEMIRVEIKEMNRIARNERKKAFLKRYPGKAEESRFLQQAPEPFTKDPDYIEYKFETPKRTPKKEYIEAKTIGFKKGEVESDDEIYAPLERGRRGTFRKDPLPKNPLYSYIYEPLTKEKNEPRVVNKLKELLEKTPDEEDRIKLLDASRDKNTKDAENYALLVKLNKIDPMTKKEKKIVRTVVKNLNKAIADYNEAEEYHNNVDKIKVVSGKKQGILKKV